MSDARSLLRAHRAANRIEHPHAAYSDAGKLLCKLCREVVRSEAGWDNHLRSSNHEQKEAESVAIPAPSIESTSKRKHDDVEEMDVNYGDSLDNPQPKKRNMTASTTNGDKEKSGTPPGLNRRTSTTPAQGFEISIPSRPATPQIGEGSQTSTPNMPPLGRSPLIGLGPEHAGAPNISHLPISTESLPVSTIAATTGAPTSGAIDEAEWAAFEAEVASPDYADAVISAPALTAGEVAAKSQEEENERRKHLLDTEIADEKEDATRALEDEFAEMAQLESRVRKLKERREELRKGTVANLGSTAMDSTIEKTVKEALGKENASSTNAVDMESDEDEDDDEDWDDGFRFRGA
ncbi:hypothetical protein PFICI_15276 [Pestalotiopsis fici W106-1]|uniref:C2H2-type domain-containing protein n=1 Tax=Pestalotiopsis fici (strain W106-1 / CGMCC3.15140) TaxID=1229662 RepID=W3WJW9_PESFW|nr:uncharacterized protein PFICI_15276 [Pestalotiopsis fici W106-1]ETS73101.1 hypothetical protein PFICI_15276 [Pestalotiopsis fici W106-1]